MDEKSLNSEFVEFLTPNYYKIHSFILTLVLNKADAEDVLQSAITYMWEHFNDFKKETNFLSWAFTIAKYQVLTYRKKKQRSRIHFDDNAIALIESENKKLSLEMEVRYNALDKCIKKLPYEELTYIKKHFGDNIPVIALASEFGISANMAYKRIARIKNLLLNCIRQVIAVGEVS